MLRAAKIPSPRRMIHRTLAAVVATAFVLVAVALHAQPLSGPEILPPSSGEEAWPSAPWSPPTTPMPAEDQMAKDRDSSVLDDGLDEELPPPEFDSVPSWYELRYWFGPTPWDTGIELGINGSTGSNESFSLRTGGYVKRESRYSKLDVSIYHNRTSNGGVTTQDNAKLDFRNDWLLDDSTPWTLFFKGTVFFDQFQAFDLQTNANSGVGYHFFDEPDVKLVARIGAGATREFGGPEDRWMAEGIAGFEYEQRVSSTQKLTAKVDYHPQFEQFDDYRVISEASWEIELDRPSNLSLKLSATDRFDSTPNGADPHLVNYSILLLLKL